METINILLVDDQPANLMVLENIIQSADLNLLKATSGDDALKLASKHDLALIFLDVQMPGMDGYETANLLRSDTKNQLVPIIFLTAIDRDEKHALEGYLTGAVDFIFKPIDRIVLQSKTQVFINLEKQKRIIGKQKKALEEKNHQLTEEIAARQFAEKTIQASYQKIWHQKEQIDNDLEEAKQAQRGLLPHTIPSFHNAKIAFKYQPMEQIGGDLFDVVELAENKVGFMIADVSGHGISAALLSFTLANVFQYNLAKTSSPKSLLTRINQDLANKLPDAKFVTLYFAVYDATLQTLDYSSAGHPPALVIRPTSEEIIELDSSGYLLGWLPDEAIVYEEGHIQLFPQDKVLFYTDAIYEVTNKQGEQLKIHGFQRLLKQMMDRPIEELLEELYHRGLEYSEFAGLGDDLTLLGLEVEK